MGWFDNRRQDVEAAIVGATIGWEARTQGIEDEMDWSTIYDIADEAGLDLTEARQCILDKAIDLGYIVRDYTS